MTEVLKLFGKAAALVVIGAVVGIGAIALVEIAWGAWG